LWTCRQRSDEPAGAYIEAKARLARRLGIDGGRIVVDGIIHGLRAETKKDVMMMRPQTVEDLLDAAEVSESSSKAAAPMTRTSDTALAAEIADMRSVITTIAAAMAERPAVAAIDAGNAGASTGPHPKTTTTATTSGGDNPVTIRCVLPDGVTAAQPGMTQPTGADRGAMGRYGRGCGRQGRWNNR